MYDSRWQRYRVAYLTHHPLCTMCRARGRTRAATVVDHIKPHRGDQVLFWDPSNHQALCQPCHDGIKQAQEKGGRLAGCGADGMPLDQQHHWNF